MNQQKIYRLNVRARSTLILCAVVINISANFDEAKTQFRDKKV